MPFYLNSNHRPCAGAPNTDLLLQPHGPTLGRRTGKTVPTKLQHNVHLTRPLLHTRMRLPLNIHLRLNPKPSPHWLPLRNKPPLRPALRLDPPLRCTSTPEKHRPTIRYGLS